MCRRPLSILENGQRCPFLLLCSLLCFVLAKYFSFPLWTLGKPLIGNRIPDYRFFGKKSCREPHMPCTISKTINKAFSTISRPGQMFETKNKLCSELGRPPYWIIVKVHPRLGAIVVKDKVDQFANILLPFPCISERISWDCLIITEETVFCRRLDQERTRCHLRQWHSSTCSTKRHRVCFHKNTNWNSGWIHWFYWILRLRSRFHLIGWGGMTFRQDDWVGDLRIKAEHL